MGVSPPVSPPSRSPFPPRPGDLTVRIVIEPHASPNDLAQAGWADIEPHYERLATSPLDDVEAWLREWSRFEELLGEAHSAALVAYTCDTGDAGKEAAQLRFSRDIGPR